MVRPEDELSQYSAEHSLNILAPFGLRIGNRRPELIVSMENQKRAAAILKNESVPTNSAIIAIQPFSLWKYKEWGINNYAKLIDFIEKEYGFPIIIIGSDDERDRAKEIVRRCRVSVHNLAGRTSIGELVGMLRASSLLIGGDSGGIHMAAAVGTPTISIFGPSSPVSWAPRGEGHHVIHKEWSCVPCRQKGCNNSEVSRCLDELSVEEVIPVIINKVVRVGSSVTIKQ